MSVYTSESPLREEFTPDVFEAKGLDMTHYGTLTWKDLVDTLVLKGDAQNIDNYRSAIKEMMEVLGYDFAMYVRGIVNNDLTASVILSNLGGDVGIQSKSMDATLAFIKASRGKGPRGEYHVFGQWLSAKYGSWAHAA